MDFSYMGRNKDKGKGNGLKFLDVENDFSSKNRKSVEPKKMQFGRSKAQKQRNLSYSVQKKVF